MAQSRIGPAPGCSGAAAPGLSLRENGKVQLVRRFAMTGIDVDDAADQDGIVGAVPTPGSDSQMAAVHEEGSGPPRAGQHCEPVTHRRESLAFFATAAGTGAPGVQRVPAIGPGAQAGREFNER
jgi:hypothetical protein